MFNAGMDDGHWQLMSSTVAALDYIEDKQDQDAEKVWRCKNMFLNSVVAASVELPSNMGHRVQQERLALMNVYDAIEKALQEFS